MRIMLNTVEEKEVDFLVWTANEDGVIIDCISISLFSSQVQEFLFRWGKVLNLQDDCLMFVRRVGLN